MRPVLIMMGLVLAQDPPQVVLIPDEGAVEKLASASPDPAFGDGIHARRPDVAENGPDPGISEDRVECGKPAPDGDAAHNGSCPIFWPIWTR